MNKIQDDSKEDYYKIKGKMEIQKDLNNASNIQSEADILNE